ncbi:hypothetical protein [Serinibacter arcticus]|uniref:hypothetical protein n=1 Tax=Serinibacter arcticus TaxID=1655435 RepID=UPI0018EEA62F|nr:hypothetical protein [Serinibacter arcticus]
MEAFRCNSRQGASSLCPGWDVHDVGRYPAASVTGALTLQLRTSGSTGGGRDRVRGLRVVTDDAALDVGTGPLVHGSALDLLLAVSGRPVPDGALRGPGAARLGSAGDTLS